jgi:hypothetical protein
MYSPPIRSSLWFTPAEPRLPIPDSLRIPADWGERCKGPQAEPQGRDARHARQFAAADQGSDLPLPGVTAARKRRRGTIAPVVREEAPLNPAGGARDGPPPPLSRSAAVSTMDVSPFTLSPEGTFEHEGVLHVAPLLPSDLGDSSLDDSEEVLVVELRDAKGQAGWVHHRKGAPTHAVLRSKSGLMRVPIAEVVTLVKGRVDVLASRSRILSRSLYSACSPIKGCSLIVTLVKSEDLLWEPVGA